MKKKHFYFDLPAKKKKKKKKKEYTRVNWLKIIFSYLGLKFWRILPRVNLQVVAVVHGGFGCLLGVGLPNGSGVCGRDSQAPIVNCR